MTGLDPNKHLTVDEAAVALGNVHRRTVWRYIAKGLLACFKHGGRTYIHRDQIDEYFKRLTDAGDLQRAKNAKRAR